VGPYFFLSLRGIVIRETSKTFDVSMVVRMLLIFSPLGYVECLGNEVRITGGLNVMVPLITHSNNERLTHKCHKCVYNDRTALLIPP
jgi:hypothetical protein